MNSIILLVLGMTIAPVFSESRTFEGLCPISEVDVVKDFNQTQFQGFWYVIERYELAEYQRCARYNYMWDQGIREFNQILKQKTRYPGEPGTSGTQVIHSIIEEKEKFSNTGKYVLQYSIVHLQDYHFVDTDYENYAVLWTCLQRIGKHEQNLVVMARNKFFDINSSESLNATLSKAPFDRNLLKPIDHKDTMCEQDIAEK